MEFIEAGHGTPHTAPGGLGWHLDDALFLVLHKFLETALEPLPVFWRQAFNGLAQFPLESTVGIIQQNTVGRQTLNNVHVFR